MKCVYCHKPTTDPRRVHQACVDELQARWSRGECVVCGNPLEDRDREANSNCHGMCEDAAFHGY